MNMEKKTKYRILGILLVVGLIIVLLPLFFGEKSTETPDVAVIKTPPFPEQNVQMNNSAEAANDVEPIDLTKDESDRAISDPITQPSVGDNGVENGNQSTELPTNVVENKESGVDKQNTDSTTSDTQKTLSNNNVNSTPNAPNGDSSNKTDIDNTAASSLITKSEQLKTNDDSTALPRRSEQSVSNQKDNQAANRARKPGPEQILSANKHIAQKILKSPLNKNGLIDLKKPAWVIQIGSFKNKTNAIHLVNRLRAKGYPAFIQHVNNAAFGETIRVYVGPADKQKEASQLLSQMEKDVHVAGIIISYKPLAL